MSCPCPQCQEPPAHARIVKAFHRLGYGDLAQQSWGICSQHPQLMALRGAGLECGADPSLERCPFLGLLRLPSCIEHTLLGNSNVSGPILGAPRTQQTKFQAWQSFVQVRETDTGQIVIKTAEEHRALGEGATLGSFFFFKI